MADDKKPNPFKVTTPPFRVAFAAVFKARSFQGQEPKYSLDMLFPPGTDLTPMKKAAHAAAAKKWGNDPKDWPKFKNPTFKDGNEKTYDGYKDTTVVTASSKERPGVVDQNLNEIIEQSEFYSGCWARATVVAYAYDNMGNRGVSFGLNNLQKVKDDAKFSGRKNAKDEFDIIETDESEFSETNEAAAEYGF